MIFYFDSEIDNHSSEFTGVSRVNSGSNNQVLYYYIIYSIMNVTLTGL